MSSVKGKKETAHALLSASGSHKWLHCTPSARLEASIHEGTSTYAEEGTLAHEMCELKLRKTFIVGMGARTYQSHLKKIKDKPLFSEEMLQYTDSYVDYIKGLAHEFSMPPYVAIEKRVDYSDYAPEGFGTADCILIAGRVLHIIDFKYGKGVKVSAERNTQLMLYALGACSIYGFLYDFDTVKMVIVQPRMGEPSEWSMSTQELLAWGDDVKPIAAKAFAGEGDFVPDDHCKFCRAKVVCRARADTHLSLDEFNTQLPPIITDEEVGLILHRARNLAKWLKHVEAYALDKLLSGGEIPGWKAINGVGRRAISDVGGAHKVLIDAGYAEEMLYNKNPITLTEAEALVGGAKKLTELIGSYIIKPPGAPILALESDKREAVKTAADDFSDPVEPVTDIDFLKALEIGNRELPF